MNENRMKSTPSKPGWSYNKKNAARLARISAGESEIPVYRASPLAPPFYIYKLVMT